MITETTALTVQQRAAVALGSSKAEIELAELAAKSKDIIAITNKDGRQECHAAAMVAKGARVSIENAGKAAREDATAFSKAVIAEEKRLVGLIKPEEDRLIVLRDNWDAKIKAEREAAEALARKNTEAESANPAVVEKPVCVEQMQKSETQPVLTVASETQAAVQTIRLGEINTLLGCVSVTADQLASLGIHPVATDKNAKLYDANKFPTVCRLISEAVMAKAFKKAA